MNYHTYLCVLERLVPASEVCFDRERSRINLADAICVTYLGASVRLAVAEPGPSQ